MKRILIYLFLVAANDVFCAGEEIFEIGTKRKSQYPNIMWIIKNKNTFFYNDNFPKFTIIQVFFNTKL